MVLITILFASLVLMSKLVLFVPKFDTLHEQVFSLTILLSLFYFIYYALGDVSEVIVFFLKFWIFTFELLDLIINFINLLHFFFGNDIHVRKNFLFLFLDLPQSLFNFLMSLFSFFQCHLLVIFFLWIFRIFKEIIKALKENWLCFLYHLLLRNQLSFLLHSPFDSFEILFSSKIILLIEMFFEFESCEAQKERIQ